MKWSPISSWAGVAVGLLVIFAAACRDDGGEIDEVVDEVADEIEVETETEPQLREIFGLPLPPEYLGIRHGDRRAVVTTRMRLEELQAFFESRHLEDHEVLRVGERIELVPLRPHLSSAQARYFMGPRTAINITYSLPRDPAELAAARPPLPEPDEEEPQHRVIVSGQEDRPFSNPQGERPEWLDGLRGQPVQLRTEDGALLAPGARWGEPYVPPEGTPLHTDRNRHNFGRPFGDWRAH